MVFDDKEIEEIVQALDLKIKKSLKETNSQNREDLKQDLLEKIIKILKSNKIEDVPSFFDIIEKDEIE